MSDPRGPRRNGSRPDRSQSRFFSNRVRTLSLIFFLVAVAALVIGGGFAEISSNGAPTSLETAVVRWVIVGSLAAGIVSYVVGGRMLERGRP